MDIKFKTNTEEFHARTCGIIKQDDKFLIMRVNKTPYYHIPGGHIEIGEDSKKALEREILKEIGCTIKEVTLFVIQENFWERNNRNCHGIEFYYIVTPNEKLETIDSEKIDKGEEKLLEFKWATREELKDIDLKPNNIKDIIVSGKYMQELKHIVAK